MLRVAEWVLASRRSRPFQAAQLLVAVGYLDACATSRVARASADGGPHQNGKTMTVSDSVGSGGPPTTLGPAAGSPQQSALGAYLRTVADALLAQDAGVDAVLAAAHARNVERGSTQAYFRPPDPRLSRGVFDAGELEAPNRPAGSVTFYCDPGQGRVTLAELVAAFGPWVQGVPPTAPVPRWPVIFTTPYGGGTPTRPGADVVTVTAHLLSDPSQVTARVADIDLQRERANTR